MRAFTGPLGSYGEWLNIKEDIERRVFPLALSGCADTQKCHQVFSLSEGFGKKLIITYSEAKASEFLEDYRFFDGNILKYPSKDVIFFSADVHGNLLVKERARVMRKLLDDEPVTVVTTIGALMDRVLPLSKLKESLIRIVPGMELDPEELTQRLTDMGFTRNYQVEAPGEFAVRGGIIDVFNLSDDAPVRLEFFDTEVDSVRSFDSVSQRSVENLKSFTVYPASEYVFSREEREDAVKAIEKDLKKRLKYLEGKELFSERNRLSSDIAEFTEGVRETYDATNIDGFIGYFTEDTVSFLDNFTDDDSIIWVDEPVRTEETAKAVSGEFIEGMAGRLAGGYILPKQADILFPVKYIFDILNDGRAVLMSSIYKKSRAFKEKSLRSISVRSVDSFADNFSLLKKDLFDKQKKGYRVIVAAGAATRAERLASEFIDMGLSAFYTPDRDREPEKGRIMVTTGNLHHGLEYPLIRFAIYSESDIFGERKKKKKRTPKYQGEKISGFSALSPGDYVVHVNHGLGIYRGIENIEIDGVAKDYIKIEYAGSGVLYIPAVQLDLIQKYTGTKDRKPKLNSLYSPEWSRTKARVKGAVEELAGDLLKLYAARQAKTGHTFSPDTVWQREFEEEFPFEETGDQLKAIEDTKKDMESGAIMDRLICGDVGYGKTEVAIRAAFKAVQDNKQVAMLVPTTILAQQHYNTFLDRFRNFPVNVEMLCRFRTKKEQAQIVKKLEAGAVDIIIGTHRLLSKDVKYKDLGLLIVDEEQRLGVAHKEKIKHLKENVDVLTLTATPIPRTLHMGLSGIRDMSILEEPPEDRQPIQTYVMEFNEEIIREAIEREIRRGGQVYFVYNHIASIADMTLKIQSLVPGATVEYAHGRMTETRLEDIMYRFINREVDVLVSTTIIETGLDIANVNTMIINDADKMGLAQLYQLRGRIGRSSRTAYAFLMYRKDRLIKEVAEKRLKAIREFTDLGSGFKLAMRDLEIRGAGDLLGARQSGHMEAVGYDLYCRMLRDAVRSLKGEEPEDTGTETEIDVSVDAFIPSAYIRNEAKKLDMYRRISFIRSAEDFDEIYDELTDRFGDVPKETENLMKIALIKELAGSIHITSVKHNDRELVLTMDENADINVAGIPELMNMYGGRLSFKNVQPPYFIYRPDREDKKDPLKCEFSVIKNFKALLEYK